MVKEIDQHIITKAIAEAEKTTSAKLSVVVAPASDAYQSYCMLYGLALGSIISIGLWTEKLVVDFPLLLSIQLIVTAIASFIPWLRHALICLVPRHVRHHYAAHRAYEEYLIVSRHAEAEHPLVLLYISLAERYAHILTSRVVCKKIPDEEWNAVIDTFTKSMTKEGLQTACTEAIEHAALLLSAHFPQN